MSSSENRTGDVRAGQLYRHFKGGRYRVVCVASDSESKAPFVVYQDVDNPTKVWVRSLEQFVDVHPEKKVKRFTLEAESDASFGPGVQDPVS